ncbi:MAG: choice-of-anchor Q domain-containing protein, partial [Usitatibacteraceae bacterium]
IVPFLSTPLAHAAGNVSVCDEANFRFALIGGGLVTFSCSGTITLTSSLGGTILLPDRVIIDGSRQDVTITNNGDFYLFKTAFEATLKDLTISGGGLYLNGLGPMTFQAMTFKNTKSGAIFAFQANVAVIDSAFIDNTLPVGGAFGGAIALDRSNLSIRNSEFRNNSARHGGAIDAVGSIIQIVDSVFDSNIAAPTDGTSALGGAIYVKESDLGITRSVLFNNVAQGDAGSGSTGASGSSAFGGAIYMDSGTRPVNMSIDNTTLSGNRALGGNGGSGFSVSGNGGLAVAGAISQAGGIGGEIRISSVTLVDNFARGGLPGGCLALACRLGATGNAENLIYRIAARVVAKNSLFVTSFGGTCVSYPGLDDRGFNLEFGSSGCTNPSTASNRYADPLVFPLADNGGPTPTVALAAGSPAIGAGAIGCLSVADLVNTVDQRGLPRKTPRCDIGAYETQPLPMAALTAVLSRKLHGPVGPFDLAIDQTVPIGGVITVEPRTIGSGHTIVFQFDAPIISVGAVSAVDGAASPVGAATAAIVGNSIEVTLTGVPDNQRALVSLSNINGIGINASAAVGFLAGDVNNTRSVNSSDISGVKARSGQTTTASNFLFDVNASGAINSSDISAVKARSGLVLSP